MNGLFVSEDRQLIQSYRRAPLFRLAGFSVFIFVLLQVPLLALGVWLWYHFQQESSALLEQGSRTAQLTIEAGKLREVKKQVQQIHAWEPILNGRIPASAFLSAIERSVFEEVVIDRVSIENSGQKNQPARNGFYRVPDNYSIVIQGNLRGSARENLQRLKDNLKRLFPVSTQVQNSDLLEKRSDALTPFALIYSVKADGNYANLGLTRIAQPDSL